MVLSRQTMGELLQILHLIEVMEVFVLSLSVITAQQLHEQIESLAVAFSFDRQHVLADLEICKFVVSVGQAKVVTCAITLDT